MLAELLQYMRKCVIRFDGDRFLSHHFLNLQFLAKRAVVSDCRTDVSVRNNPHEASRLIKDGQLMDGLGAGNLFGT